MKASKAPERIWIDPATDLPKLSGHIDKDSVGYIRKDAFIEKACEFLNYKIKKGGYLCDSYIKQVKEEFIEDFKDYLQNESEMPKKP